MKTVNAKNLGDYEYKAERLQEKKQTKAFREQRKNRKQQWEIV